MLKSAFAMKKLIAVVLVTSFFVFVPLVHAEDNSTPSGSPRPFIQRVRDVRQDIKENIASREGQRQTNIAALRKDIVTNFFNMMLGRFEAAQDRLTKILTRIESRVAKIKSADPSKDLTPVDSEIASVKTALADNQTKIDTLKTDFDSAIASTTPKERFKTVFGDISTIKRDLESIRKSLSKIIGDIKGLHVGESESPKP